MFSKAGLTEGSPTRLVHKRGEGLSSREREILEARFKSGDTDNRTPSNFLRFFYKRRDYNLMRGLVRIPPPNNYLNASVGLPDPLCRTSQL